MTRFFASLFIGAVIGVGVGLLLGWGPLKVVIVDNPATRLHEQYQDEYTIMIASGFLVDGDALGAVERLRVLGVPNAPEHVQTVTERYITHSRNIEDIRKLVALLEALIGQERLPDMMRPYRMINE